MKTYSLLAGILLSFSLSIQAGDLKLWYKQPAGTWVEALPVGNSRMGAMVYGGTAREELQLNDETMWGGSPYRNDKPEALESLPQVRELIFAGKNMEAQNLIQENFYAGKHGMPYPTIIIDFVSIYFKTSLKLICDSVTFTHFCTDSTAYA